MQTSTQLMQLGRRQLLRSPRAFSSPVNLGRRAGAPGPVCSTAAGATVATAAEPQAAGAPEKATGEKVAQRCVQEDG